MVEKCRFMDSAAAPIWVTFTSSLPGHNVAVIFKMLDDIKQDMLILQALKLMDTIWKENGLDLRLSVYNCTATGSKEGFIEVVPNATTSGKIQKEHSGATGAFKKTPMAKWLRSVNEHDEDHMEAVNNFTHSCAAYCVASYILGLGDRHNDNIMVTKSGQLFRKSLDVWTHFDTQILILRTF